MANIPKFIEFELNIEVAPHVHFMVLIVTSMTMKQNGFIIDVTSIEELFNITIWNF